VRLTAVSQNAAQDLIELHAEIVNTALTEAAAQIERLAYTESVRDLARMQGDVLQAARERIVEDMARAVTILKDAAGDARKAVAPPAPAARKTPARQSPARRKTKARAKAKTKTKTVAKSRSKAAARRTSRR
jgi:phasin family protein